MSQALHLTSQVYQFAVKTCRALLLFWQYRAQPQSGDSSRLKEHSLVLCAFFLLAVGFLYLAIPERFAWTQQVKGVGKHHTLAKGNHIVNYTEKKVF